MKIPIFAICPLTPKYEIPCSIFDIHMFQFEIPTRLFLHLGFWLFYLLLNGYIEVALVNYSFFDLPFWERVYKGFAPEFLALIPVIVVTYFIMYYLLPRHFEKKTYARLALEGLVALMLAIVFYRLILIYIIYPFIYQETYEFQPFEAMFPRHVWKLLDIVSIVAIAVSIKLSRLRLAGAEREKRLIQEKLESELNFLRAQTNPHFLFNTLNNIYALARKKSDQTADVVMRLSKILRFMLYECTTPLIPLGDEIKILEDYVELEKLRYNNRLSLNFEARLDEPQTPIAPLLLLPLVENAFKHGVSETRFESRVDIHLELKKQRLRFEVRNTKALDLEEPASGIGLSNVQRQLELIYPGRYDLKISTEKDTFLVKLQLNLAQNETITLPDRGR